MSYNKMNVLHMHISDMPSFPFVSTSLPQLSANGAFDSKHVYTPKMIADLIAYAKARGVRVIPEFDVGSVSQFDVGSISHDVEPLAGSISHVPFMGPCGCAGWK